MASWQINEDDDPVAEVIRLIRQPLKKQHKKALLGVAAFLVVAIAAGTSYYQVEPDEVGVLLRLGKFTGTSEPGPHFRIPFGIDQVYKVPVQRQLKAEFGFRSDANTSRRQVAPNTRRLHDSEPGRESLMLTGDLNVAVVEWIVQYKVRDPYMYLFKVRNVEESLRNLSEASMRFVVGDHSVNEVLTAGRQKIATESKILLQELADRYNTGVEIQQVVLQDVNPPDPVKPSFNEVNQAIQEKERAINDARAELNKVIPRAGGEAEQMVRAAEGHAIERVNRAQGEAERFSAIYEEYRKAPDVTRRRLYLETVAEVLAKAGTKVIVDDGTKSLTPILRMDQGGDIVPAIRGAK